MAAGECERPIGRILYGRKKIGYFFELLAKIEKSIDIAKQPKYGLSGQFRG